MAEQENGGCCKVTENLELEKSSDLTSCYIREYRCKVCGNLHRRMSLKPIVMKFRQSEK